jgi:hypothetical protein
MDITRNKIKSLISNIDLVASLPFLRPIMEECKSRIINNKKSSPCSGCIGPVYLEDQIEKAILKFKSLNEEDKKKTFSFFNTNESIYLISKVDGTTIKELIVANGPRN